MVTFSPDLKHVYFTSNNYMEGNLKTGGLKIFKATVSESGHWKDIVTLTF